MDIQQLLATATSQTSTAKSIPPVAAERPGIFAHQMALAALRTEVRADAEAALANTATAETALADVLTTTTGEEEGSKDVFDGTFDSIFGSISDQTAGNGQTLSERLSLKQGDQLPLEQGEQLLVLLAQKLSPEASRELMAQLSTELAAQLPAAESEAALETFMQSLSTEQLDALFAQFADQVTPDAFGELLVRLADQVPPDAFGELLARLADQ
ncbi:MAG: hypothetical protein VBE63_04575, partial [Lamprobacter sp.]|uniref:hypothetical protein n=1 Tax=Lamprobacter sp. TaxID=3100796 RepID=UPI002B256C64